MDEKKYSYCGVFISNHVVIDRLIMYSHHY